MRWGKNYGIFLISVIWITQIIRTTTFLGDIINHRVYDKHTIVLNAYEDNTELLDKRSAI